MKQRAVCSSQCVVETRYTAVLNDWVLKNYSYIRMALNMWFFVLHGGVNYRLTTIENIFNSLENYMLDIAFHMYINNKLTTNFTNENVLVQRGLATDNMFWKLCLINLTCSYIAGFPQVTYQQNCTNIQWFSCFIGADKSYKLSMQKSFRDYFVAKCLWDDLINGSLDPLIIKLHSKNLTEEPQVINFLLDFFKRLDNVEIQKSVLNLIIKSLECINERDNNSFEGASILLKNFGAVLEEVFQREKEPVFFSYFSLPVVGDDKKVQDVCLQEQNKFALQYKLF